MEVRLLEHSSINVIRKGFGICTGKLTIPKENLQHWIQVGHLSPIEHSFASFYISGISRACSHQIVRHRLASYSQRSQRYCAEEEWNPIVPDSLDDGKRRWIYDGFMKNAKLAYKKLTEDFGVPEEDARFVLPNATPTELIMTANFREWRHFIKVRNTEHAQWEIREVAKRVLEQLYEVAPEIFEDLLVEHENPVN